MEDSEPQHYSITVHLGSLWRPDTAHDGALSASAVNTEIRGAEINLGQFFVCANCVQTKLLEAVKSNELVDLHFTLRFTENISLKLETTAWRGTLYICVPNCLLPEGSKNAFVFLLDYAEETLQCKNIVVYFHKDRTDRAVLVRTFRFMGFTVLPPIHDLVPLTNLITRNVYMLYTDDY